MWADFWMAENWYYTIGEWKKSLFDWAVSQFVSGAAKLCRSSECINLKRNVQNIISLAVKTVYVTAVYSTSRHTKTEFYVTALMNGDLSVKLTPGVGGKIKDRGGSVSNMLSSRQIMPIVWESWKSKNYRVSSWEKSCLWWYWFVRYKVSRKWVVIQG